MLANTSWHHWGDTKTVTAVLLQGMREVDFAWKPTFLKLFCDLQLYCSKTNNWFSQVPPTTFCMGVMRSRVTWATGYLSEEAEGSEQGSPGGCWLCVDWTSLQESQSQAYRAKRGLSDYGEWKRRVDTTDDSGPTEQICRSVWDWLLFTVHVPSSVSVKINSSRQTSIFWKMFLSPTPSSRSPGVEVNHSAASVCCGVCGSQPDVWGVPPPTGTRFLEGCRASQTKGRM